MIFRCKTCANFVCGISALFAVHVYGMQSTNKAQREAFLSALHPRLGAQSAAFLMDQNIAREILQYLPSTKPVLVRNEDEGCLLVELSQVQAVTGVLVGFSQRINLGRSSMNPTRGCRSARQMAAAYLSESKVVNIPNVQDVQVAVLDAENNAILGAHQFNKQQLNETSRICVTRRSVTAVNLAGARQVYIIN